MAHPAGPGRRRGALPVPAFPWLLAGGLFYAIGVLFFAFDPRVRHFRGVRPLFVMAGSVSHYVAVPG